MKTSEWNFSGSRRFATSRAKTARGMAHPFWTLLVLFLVAVSCLALAQEKKSAKSDLTGHYEGTAKDKADEVIDVAFDLMEKEGVVSGVIHSSHGDFTITGGSCKGDDVTLEFNAEGDAGTISLRRNEDKLSGTWSTGDDGGAIEVKRAVQENGEKKKS